MANVSTVICDTTTLHAVSVQDSDNKFGFMLTTLVGKTDEYYEAMGYCTVAYTPEWGKMAPSVSHLIIF